MSAGAIVCVDDRRDILAAIIRDLSELAGVYEFVTCESASEAHQVIQERQGLGHTLSLLITDHVMPGESGLELMRRLKEDQQLSHLPTLLLSGEMVDEDFPCDVLPKPWTREQLVRTVKRLLG